MAEIPDNPVTEADLAAWWHAKKEAAKWKAQEMLLRLKIFKGWFTDPQEGVNKHPMPNNFEMVATLPYDRKVDEAVLLTIKDQLAEKGVAVDKLIRWKPELAVGEYRKLTAENKLLFDQCLTTKPGSPALEVKNNNPKPKD